VMQNHSVALYSCNANSFFARLVVHSRSMDALPRSMDMRSFPLMADMQTKGITFANTQLEPGYPAFCAPLMQDDRAIAMIALWDVPFEQQTLYRQNLFSVVSGLVQSAMVRALNYFGSAQDMYIKDTHILTDKAFRATLGVYSQMRKQHASAYILLNVISTDNNTSIEEYDRRIGHAIRGTDIAGQMNNGKIYALLPQASLENMPQIEKRFLASGLNCTVAS
jgi:UDP-glucuronate decarboxylase